MNFESFEDLVGEKNFDEIKIIGKDVRYMGEPSHFAAMVRKGDQAELCILMQKKIGRSQTGANGSVVSPESSGIGIL